MAKIKKRGWILFLSLIVLLGTSLASGCAKREKKAAEPMPTAAKEEVKMEQPIVLTMSTPQFEKSFQAGFQEDPVMKEIEKRLNIKLNIIPANAVSDINAKFAAELASGELPDIAWAPSADLYNKIISAHAAVPMDELLEKYGQDILKRTPYRVEYSRKFLGKDVDGNSDGKMYFLGLRGDSEADPLQVQVGPYLRYDLWEKLGFPKLETMDDYLPVLAEMMKLEPKNADGKKTYGVTGWFGDVWGDWAINAPFGMFEGKAQIGTWGSWDMVKKQYTSSLTDPDSFFWKGVAWFNKANQMGVLDPDSFTMKWDNYLEKAAANRVFLGWAPWNIDGGNQTFEKNGTPEKGFFQMPAPNDLDQYMVSFEQPQGAQMMFISKKSKHPEKAMELLNFLISDEGTELILNGVKGVHWDEVDGKPQVKQEVLDGLKNDPDYRIKSGVYKYHNIAGRGNSVINEKYNTPIYFMYLPDVVKTRLTTVQKAGSAHFGEVLPGDLYKDKKETNFDTSYTTGMPSLTDGLKEIDTKLTNYVKTNQIKMILIKTDKEFEAEKAKFIEEAKKLGADEIVKWHQEELVKLKGQSL
ncbi:MAG TPA: extracellular solute-binding protein [Bacilli bacterium]